MGCSVSVLLGCSVPRRNVSVLSSRFQATSIHARNFRCVLTALFLSDTGQWEKNQKSGWGVFETPERRSVSFAHVFLRGAARACVPACGAVSTVLHLCGFYTYCIKYNRQRTIHTFILCLGTKGIG